jgi:hypothetical protein
MATINSKAATNMRKVSSPFSVASTLAEVLLFDIAVGDPLVRVPESSRRPVVAFTTSLPVVTGNLFNAIASDAIVLDCMTDWARVPETDPISITIVTAKNICRMKTPPSGFYIVSCAAQKMAIVQKGSKSRELFRHALSHFQLLIGICSKARRYCLLLVRCRQLSGFHVLWRSAIAIGIGFLPVPRIAAHISQRSACLPAQQ